MPRKAPLRTRRFTVRLRPQEYERVDQAAAKRNETFAEFVRNAAVRYARTVVREK